MVKSSPSKLVKTKGEEDKVSSDSDVNDVTFMDHVTRYVMVSLATEMYQLSVVSSLPSPEVDFSDVGTRDPNLASTYDGLVNIQFEICPPLLLLS